MLGRHLCSLSTKKVVYVCCKIQYLMTMVLSRDWLEILCLNDRFSFALIVRTDSTWHFTLHYLCLSIQESGHGNATWPFLKRERKLIPSDPHNRGSVLQSVRVACNMHQWLWCHHWRQHSNQGFFGLISCGFGDALVTNFDGRKSVATSQKGIHWLCFYSSEGRRLAIPSNNQDWMNHLKPNLKVD